jgi:hypothetical protein
MRDFFMAELRRLRVCAAVYGLANLVALAVLQQMVDIPNGPIGLHVLMVAFYMLSGLGLAVFQFSSYRQASRWIWLQHRPVHRARILAAFVLAAAAAIAAAVALPLCALLLVTSHATHHVIDTAHFAGAAWLALAALMAWAAGGIIMLHRSRWAFVVLVLPVVLTMRLSDAATVLGLTAGCLAILLGLMYTVFRPSRSAANDPRATAASALPLQVALYVALVWTGSFLYQAGLLATGAHPVLNHVSRPGSFATIRPATATESLTAALADSRDPRAPGWRAALSPDATASFNWPIYQYGVPGLMTTSKGLGRVAAGESEWTFNRDRMQYHGVNRRTNEDGGWFGPGAPGTRERFDTIPIAEADNRKGRWIFDAHNLYRFDDQGPRLHHVLRVAGQEQLAGSVEPLGQRTLILTNRRLAILESATATPAPAVDVRLPLPYGDLERVKAARVPDGTLVTFLYGHRQADGSPVSQQVTFFVDTAGHVQEVGRRELAHDFPALFEHRSWWVSPALHALVSLPDLLVDNGTVPDYGASRFAPLLWPRPAIVWTAALAAALLAGIGAAWWTRRTHLGRTARSAWCMACLLLGVPALLSLMILQPRRQAVTSAEGAIYTGGFINLPRKS